MLREVQRLEEALNSAKFSNKSTFSLVDKMSSNNNKLVDTNYVANEIIDRDKLTAFELRRQGEQLINVNNTLENAEGQLTLIQQIQGVMKQNHLFYKLKLYGIILLLFIANLIVLYLKFH